MNYCERDRTRLFLILLFFSFSPICGLPAGFAGGWEESEEALAYVDEKPVVKREVEKMIKAFFLTEEGRREWDISIDADRRRMRAEMLEMLVERRILLGAAKKKLDGMGQIEASVEETVEQIVEEEKERAGSRLKLIEEMHELGITLNEWKGFQADTVLINTYLAEAVSVPHVRPAEMKEYYLRHKDDYSVPGKIYYQRIYLAPEGREDAGQVRERAEQVREMAEEGHCFLDLAQRHCFNYDEDEDGLRIVEIPENNPDWRPSEINGLEEGEISEVKEGRGRIHVIAMLDRIEPAGIKRFEEVQGEIRRNLMQEKETRARSRLLEELREKSEVRFTEKGKELVGEAEPRDFWR